MLRRGHTLMELMVVLTLIVMMVTLVIPRYAPRLSAAEVDGERDKLIAALQFARGRAAATGKRHSVAFDIDFGSYALYEIDPDGDPDGELFQDPLSEELLILLEEWYLPETVFFERIAAAPLRGGLVDPLSLMGGMTTEWADTITFYPEGSADSATIVLVTADGARRGVMVQPITGEPTPLAEDEIGAQAAPPVWR